MFSVPLLWKLRIALVGGLGTLTKFSGVRDKAVRVTEGFLIDEV